MLILVGIQFALRVSVVRRQLLCSKVNIQVKSVKTNYIGYSSRNIYKYVYQKYQKIVSEMPRITIITYFRMFSTLNCKS